MNDKAKPQNPSTLIRLSIEATARQASIRAFAEARQLLQWIYNFSGG